MQFDVIIVGGSYAGMAAAMGLGRALRKVLVIDSGLPANRFTPASHNFLTHDGKRPSEITEIARQQVAQYKSVQIMDGLVVNAGRTPEGFEVHTASGEQHTCSKLVFATGIIDVVPDIDGLADCWGKSVLHCPYCHGFEVRDTKTGIIGNGEYAFEFGALISNWTSDLTIYTNGVSQLTAEQSDRLTSHNVRIFQTPIRSIRHTDGYVDAIVFDNGDKADVQTIYTKPGFRQHSEIPHSLGCEITDDGYIRIDSSFRTTVPGVYACGDNVTRMRTVANAVAMGTSTAITLNKDLLFQNF